MKEKIIDVLDKRGKVNLGSQKIKNRDIRIKILRRGLLTSLLFLIIVYGFLQALYAEDAFTVSIDQNFSKETGIVAYEKLDEKDYKILMKAEKIEFADNISINWIPQNINDEAEGAHNGDNYLAYTFYVQNMGQNTANYWYSIVVDDVIRNVDTAIRIMTFLNGEKKVYAKIASNGEAEPGTIPFFSDEYIMIEKRGDFNPGDIDKFTIVVWIEGDDPECLNDLIGGQMNMHMDIRGEQINQDLEKEE